MIGWLLETSLNLIVRTPAFDTYIEINVSDYPTDNSIFSELFTATAYLSCDQCLKDFQNEE